MINISIIGQRSLPSQELVKLLHSPGISVNVIPQEIISDSDTLCKLVKDSQIVVIAGHGFISKEVLPLINNKIVIDLSPEFRTNPDWDYCNPYVLQPAKHARAAGPGCFATGAITILKPLADLHLLSNTPFIYINSINGYSAGGHKLTERVDLGEFNTTRYSVGDEHRHISEIRTHAGITGPISMSPVIGQHHRGLMTCIPIQCDSDIIKNALYEFYSGTSVTVVNSIPKTIEVTDYSCKTGAAICVVPKPFGCEVISLMDNILFGSVEHVASYIDEITLMLDT